MKWTPIKRMDSYEDVISCREFAGFLFDLNLKSAEDALDNICNIIDDDFCYECQVLTDDCECRSYSGNYYRDDDDGDRAYDAWKDSRLEEET